MSVPTNMEPAATPMVQTLRRAYRSLGIGPHTHLALIGGLGFGELLLIVLVLLFFFGAKRLPEIARGIGGGIRSFKGELREGERRPEQEQLPPEDQSAPRG